MQRSTTLEVRKHTLSDSRLAERDLPPLGEGEVLARVECFAALAGLQTAYRRVLRGKISPDRGVIVDLPGSG